MMQERFTLNGKEINSPLQFSDAKITMQWESNSLAELQPTLNIDRLTFTNAGKDEILSFKQKYGAYQKQYISYEYGGVRVFYGYLTDFNYLLDLDQIEAKAVAEESTDSLAEILSLVDSSILRNAYKKQKLLFIVEKTDIKLELFAILSSTFLYSYILYTQIKDTLEFIADVQEALANLPLAPGSTIALVTRGIAITAFLALTIVQIEKFFNQISDLLLPKVQTALVNSLHNLLETALNYVGYTLETDIDELKNVYHWTSKQSYPKSSDRCGTALGALSLVLEKYFASVFVEGKTVKILSPQSDLLESSSTFVLGDYVLDNYEENLNGQVGTREIIYASDFTDEWTLENFKGNEYIIHANTNDIQNSTIKGIEQISYGVSRCSVKTELNAVEKAYESLLAIYKQLSKTFGKNQLASLLKSRVGVAKVSNINFTTAKLVYMQGDKPKRNQYDVLSAKSDWENYHYLKSHLQNSNKKTRVINQLPIKFNKFDFVKVLTNPYFKTQDGRIGKFNKIEWEFDRDNAISDFEIRDKERVINLIEDYNEPTR